MKLLRFIAVLSFALCLMLKAQGAEAHYLPAASPSATSQAGSAVVDSAFAEQIVFEGTQDEDGCKDGCCASGMACCVAALPQMFEITTHHVANSIIALAHRPLPQGPPRTLLRPPKLAA